MNLIYPVKNLPDNRSEDCNCYYKSIYNAIISSSIDPVFISDPEGNILDISQKALDFFGLSGIEDIQGKTIFKTVLFENQDMIYTYFKEVVKNGKAETLEYSFIRSDNRRSYCEINPIVLKDAENKPRFVAAIVKDITTNKFEQKKQAAIYEISEAAAVSNNLDELYAKVHMIVKELIPADNFYIAICDEKFQTVEFPYYIDENDGPDAVIKYPAQRFGKGLTEYAISYGKPMLVSKEKQLEYLSKGLIEQVGELCTEWLGVPLKTINGKTIGLLTVQMYSSKLSYTRSDIDILSFVSTQIAMAIERKRKEESLLQLKKAVESSSEAIFITDTERLISYINPEFTRLYGYTPDEIIGKATPEILKTSLISEEIYLNYWTELKSKRNITNELMVKTKLGKVICIECSASAIIDENDQVLGYLCVQRSIEQRKEAENIKNALYKISEAANVTLDLSTLYERIHEIIKELMPVKNFYIALFDPETELISFPYFIDEYDPPQAPKKAGKGLTEYVLRTGKGILVNEDMSFELSRQGEIEVIGTPSKVWLGVPLKIFERVTGVMVLQDYENSDVYAEREKEILTFVSEQIASAIYKKSVEQELLEFTTELQNHKQLLEKRTEELTSLNSQLERSEKELQELNSAKDKYFSIIAHDLKSPFNGLLGFSNMLLQDFDQFKKDDVRVYLKYMNSSIKHIFTLVENLLDWSRIQTGRLEFNPESLNLKEYVTGVVKLLESNLLGKSISSCVEINENVLVSADKKMLTSVLQNLISNAVKFTKPGGMIRIASGIEGSNVKISVSDTGVGIDQVRLNDLFKIDKHTSTDGTEKEKGTGLGLILCKEFVEKCGGKISVASEIGKGTVFSFTLPLK
ncbi:MAG: PAS domain S-box protein [Bacillota bacterium]